MSNEELNTLMAEKVMGWFYDGEREGRLTEPAWILWNEGEEVFFEQPVVDWNPCENIEQAFMCVEKLDCWVIVK